MPNFSFKWYESNYGDPAEKLLYPAFQGHSRSGLTIVTVGRTVSGVNGDFGQSCKFFYHSSVFNAPANGCVVECWICNREVAGSNLGRGYFVLTSTQPYIPPGSVNEYQP